MSNSVEDMLKGEKLRYRMANTLRLPACFTIRFRLLNANIEQYMWPYMAGAMETGTWCKVRVGDGDDCDPANRTFHFSSENPEPYEIVHEATHMLIWATHVGQTIQTVVHEAAAYLAEKLFTLYSGESDNLSNQPHLARPLAQLAEFVKVNTKDGKANVVCPPALVGQVIAILSGNRTAQNMNQGIRQTGIGEWWKS